jgi:hypothetical protein
MLEQANKRFAKMKLEPSTHSYPQQRVLVEGGKNSRKEIELNTQTLHVIKVVKNCGSRWLKYFSQYAFATHIPTPPRSLARYPPPLLCFFDDVRKNQFCALPTTSEWGE